MEVVLKLGLLCSNNEPKARLGIRQVCQILEGEAPLPDVNGCAATPDPEDRVLQEIQSGNQSSGNGWLSSTSLTAPR
uniref:Serine-threonine/tyrosine-protein kinase catalytic domain-containing protein n=1 Tax=Picea sitchensis TaxID=3332 RepID=A9NY92_PICSI|nr:unknown [Picea sitchensis]